MGQYAPGQFHIAGLMANIPRHFPRQVLFNLEAVAGSTTLAELAVMGSSGRGNKGRLLDLNTMPLFDAVSDSLRVGVVELGTAQTVAELAALVPNYCIVLHPWIEANSNGNFLAGPAR